MIDIVAKRLAALLALVAGAVLGFGCPADPGEDPDVTPPAAIADLVAATSPSVPGGVLLTWTAVADDGAQGAPASGYELRYATVPVTEANWETASKYTHGWIPVAAGLTESRTVTGLSPGGVYHFAVKTADEVPNLSAVSNGASAQAFEGRDDTPPFAIVDLAAAPGAVPGTADLTWTATGDDGAAGAAARYEVRYALQPVTAANAASAVPFPQTWVPLPSGLTEARTVTGLTPGTTYHFSVVAVDDAGNPSFLSNSASASLPALPGLTVAYTHPQTVTFTGVWGSSGSDVFVVGNAGTILHFDGSAWTVMASGTTSDLHCVWGASGSDVFVGGASGTILHFDGSAWGPMASGTTGVVSGLWGSSGSDVHAVGWDAVNLRYDGQSWSSEGSTWYLMELWGASASDVWAVGGICGIANHLCQVRRFDGTTWNVVTGLPCCGLFDVWGASGSDVFAVGRPCLCSQSTPSIVHFDGTAWIGMTRTPTALYGLWGASGVDVFAVGEQGAVHHYDGTSWTALPSGTSSYLYDVWGASGTDVFLVGSGGVVLRYP